MKVCVLGHRGMLGHTTARFLAEAGHNVVTLESRFEADAPDRFAEEINTLTPAWCVNGIGLAPRGDTPPEQLRAINAALPALLSQRLPDGCGLIHPSTDGVFATTGANRESHEVADATDVYGLAKREAEAALSRPNDFIIRCSIIGPDAPGPARNLLSWFLQADGDVNGYTNHAWNGVTSLQWARYAADLINGDLPSNQRLLQPATLPPLSKYELLRLIGEIWSRPTRILPVDAPEPITRTLAPNIETPPLREQLIALRDWSGGAG